ncbi:ribonuclease 3 [Procambarus clarkii]|uniref:ribonuclease 3 n=1 Tax=Procambarus clarkii TaxID=6728 RepID=UPI0037421E68
MSSGSSWSGPGGLNGPQWPYSGPGNCPSPQWEMSASSGCPPYHFNQAPPPVMNAPHQSWTCTQGPTQSIVPSQVLPEAPLPDPFNFHPANLPHNQYPPPQHGPPQHGPPQCPPPNSHFTVPPRPFIGPNGPPPIASSGPIGPPPVLPFPPPGPSPGPPSCPPPGLNYSGTSCYNWGPSLSTTQLPQPGVPPPGPTRGVGSDIHQQSWPGSSWDDDRAITHRSLAEEHSSRSGLDRGLTSTISNYRDSGHARERNPPSRGQERSCHSSSRLYERDRGSLDPRYKDDRGYPDDGWRERSSSHGKPSRSPSDYSPRRRESRRCSPPRRSSKDCHDRFEGDRGSMESRFKDHVHPDKYSGDGWRERSHSRRKYSRSPPDFTSRRGEPRQYSPQHRPIKDSRDRYNRDRSCKDPRSPARPSSSSQTRSPERKRWHGSRSPDRHRSRSPERVGIGKKREKGLLENKEKQEPKKLQVLIEEEQQELAGEEAAEDEEVKPAWIRSAPADLYYQRDDKNPLVMRATKKLMLLCENMEDKLTKRGIRIREDKKKQRAEKERAQQQQQSVASRISCINVTTDVNTDEVIAVEAVDETIENDSKINDSKEESEVQKSSCERDDKEASVQCDGESELCSEKREEDGGLANHNEEMHSESTCDKGPLETATECTRKHKHKKKYKLNGQCSNTENCDSSSSSNGSDSNSSSSSDEDEEDEIDRISKELEKKRSHPDRLHPELWFNDPGEMNDGPLCRCSLKAQRSGIRHGYYVGEGHLPLCDAWTNNADHLHHYLITISPPTNFLIKTPTVILHDGHEFIFEGFSLLSHHPLEEVPTCRVIRFNIEYTILYIQEKIPDNFCIQELNIFYSYLFLELLELVDLNLNAMGDADGCPRFHFMPRFVRKLEDNGKEILSMNEVLSFLLKSSGPLIQPEDLAQLLSMSQYQWQNYADNLKGMVVTSPGMKPCSIRVDQLDRDQVSEETINYPVIVHFGIRPPQLSYAGNPEYQKAWREYVKFRHLLANMPKPSFEDKRRLEAKENRLQEMRMTSKMKRDVTIAVSSQGFYRTGIMCDVVQHAMLLPVLVCHLRFHQSLEVLEERIRYKFQTRFLLQLALTHPSYRENFGTNPDHARNSLTNCGIRQPEYGDRRIHYMNTRKRGINTLINIMSRFGRNLETESKITHNERLEFLGDAVVEFLTSIHLFHLFPSLEEGGLATYRAAIVQNQHLAVLAEKLGLDQFMLYAHGSDLCHDFELRHAMANCFEALMGAIFLDSDIEEADKVLSSTLFKDEDVLHSIWVNYPPHPIQEQEPEGDRKWIKAFPILTKLVKFEESIGVQFKHIRLLARAFTDRSIGFNNLTLGSNQRLEFLGDTVLQLVSSEYLYRYFPEHHEGHLSLLRSSLVNNRTQAVVCDDLGMTTYAMYSHLKTELKTKDRADLLEAFLGALYIDRGLEHCRTFCQVCFFPRLHQFIMNQDWNDPKSKLQQCCLTLRTMDGGEPDIPIYKVIECKGPTNTRVYTVAVYFRGRRLAKASGHSIQQAEMNAAREALMNSKELFPQLDHQRRVIEKSVKIQGVNKSESPYNERDYNKDKDRERERNRGSRKDDERRGERERPREREKLVEDRELERSRSSERNRTVREKDSSNVDRNKQVKGWEKDKLGSDREKFAGEKERFIGEKSKSNVDRERVGDSKRYKLDGDEERRYKLEADKVYNNKFPLNDQKSRGHVKYPSREGEEMDRHRDKYKGYNKNRYN